MGFLSKLFGKRSTSDDVKAEPAFETKHYINLKGCKAPTHFKSKDLQFDIRELQRSTDYCKAAPTGHQEIYRNYLKWKNECEINSDQQRIEEANKFFQQMKQEIYRGIDIPIKLSEEEICNLAAWIAVYSCDNHGLSGYSRGYVYIDILTTECINCLLFTMVFGERGNNAFLINPAFVKGNERLQEQEIPFTLQKELRIFVLLDNNVITLPQKLCGDEYCSFGLWDVINDQCFAVIRENLVWYEIEDGYPLEVAGYSERLEPVEKTLEITESLNQCRQVSEHTRNKLMLGHYIR